MGRLDDIRNKHSRNLQNTPSIPSGTEPGIGKVSSWREKTKFKVTNVSDKFNEFLEEEEEEEDNYRNNSNNKEVIYNSGADYENRNELNRVHVKIEESVNGRSSNQPVDKFVGLQDGQHTDMRNTSQRNYQETVTVTGKGSHLNKFEGLLEDKSLNVNAAENQHSNNVEVKQDRYVKQFNNIETRERVMNVASEPDENKKVQQKNTNNRNIHLINENTHKECDNTERNIIVEKRSNNTHSIPKETHITTRESKDLTIGIAGAISKTGRVNGGIGSDQMETELLSPLKVFEDVERKDRTSNRTVLRPNQEYTLAYVPTSVCAVISEIVAVEGDTEFTIDGITYIVSRKPETS